jgi:hypothetical protein
VDQISEVPALIHRSAGRGQNDASRLRKFDKLMQVPSSGLAARLIVLPKATAATWISAGVFLL